MTATLIACIAAMPWLGGTRPNASMMPAEKAKNTPAMTPQPRAVASVTAKSQSGIITAPGYTFGRANQSEVSKSCSLAISGGFTKW